MGTNRRLSNEKVWADYELTINVLDKYHLNKSCYISELIRISLELNKLSIKHSVTTFHCCTEVWIAFNSCQHDT